jgi:Ser/Thr protein kinase RdoA (MazF antagonist)
MPLIAKGRLPMTPSFPVTHSILSVHALLADVLPNYDIPSPTACMLLQAGFCHGDLHGGNAHRDQAQTQTFFNFDACGMGWRAYDIAVFRWSARLRRKEQERWEAFLRGYTEERSLRTLDIQAVPFFVAIRHVWLLGIHTSNE